MSSIVEYILRLNESQFATGIANAERSTSALDRRMSQLQSTSSSLGSALGLTFGAVGAGMLAKSIVDVGAKVEMAQIGLTTLLKSATEAQSVIRNTMDDATRTPFDFESLLMSNKALISAGVNATQARSDVLNLANAIAATGGSSDELQRMVVNLQQIKNTGDATAADIRQFAYAGINMYGLLNAAGIKAEKGARDQVISYEAIASALEKAHGVGGIYYNGLENMAGATAVTVSNLGDAVFQLKEKMFRDLKPQIEDTLRMFSEWIGKLGSAWSWINEHKALIKTLGETYLVYRASLLLAPAALSAYSAATAIATTGTLSLSAAFVAANAELIVLTGGITLAIAALYDYNKQQEVIDNRNRNSIANSGTQLKSALELELSEKRKKGESEVALRQQIGQREMAISKKGKEDELALLKSFEAEYESAKWYNRGDKAAYWAEQMEDKKGDIQRYTNQMNSIAEFMKGDTASPSTSTPMVGSNKPAIATPTRMPKISGSKNVTINVHINDMVREMKVNITNFKDDAYKLKDQMVQILTGVLNDSQIVANQ